MQKKISIGSDLTWVAPAMTNISHVLFMPCPESPVNMDFVGSLNRPLGHHQLADSVLHRNAKIVQHFHDCGRLIPHLSPIDAVVGLAQSSRQVRFSESSVLIQGLPVGFAMLFSSTPTPMLTCGLIPLPIGDACSEGNGVIVGLDPLDYDACVQGLLLDIAVGTAVSIANAILTIATGGLSLAAGLGISAMSIADGEMSRRRNSPGQDLVESRQRMRHGSTFGAEVSRYARDRLSLTDLEEL